MVDLTTLLQQNPYTRPRGVIRETGNVVRVQFRAPGDELTPAETLALTNAASGLPQPRQEAVPREGRPVLVQGENAAESAPEPAPTPRSDGVQLMLGW